jgi:hypothetical protein
MALVLADRVRETTTTAGTGTVTLGGAYAGFQSFSVIGNGNTTYYAIVDSTTGAWEVGIGTYTASGTTLSRDTVLSSSNSGSLVNFAAGTKDVIVTQPSERAVYVVGSSVVAENSATVPNALLANSTISGVSLGSNLNALTIGTGLSGTSYNGSAGVTVAIDSTVATLSGTQTLTNKNIQARVVVIADATSITINADTTDIATQANTQSAGTLTVNAPTGTPFNGQKLILRLLSSNVQTFSWNSVFQGSTDVTLPTASSGSSKYDYMGFIYNSTATKWQLVAKNFGF